MKKLLTILLLLFSSFIYSQDIEVQFHAKPGYLLRKDSDVIYVATLQCPDKTDNKTPCYFTMYLPSGTYYYASLYEKDSAEVLVTNEIVFLLKSSENSDFQIIRQ